MVRNVPLEVIASWPAANYVDPELRGNSLFIINGVFIAITIGMAFSRFYTRIFISRWIGIDDLFILLALVRTLINVPQKC
jgi:hypothetical protein